MASVQATIDLFKTLSTTDQQAVIDSFNQSSNDYYSLKNNNPSKMENGVKKWLNEKDQLHRTDTDANGQTLPALIRADGSKKWYRNDNLHRTDTDANGQTLPAVIRANGFKQWWQNYQLHRTDIVDGKLQPAVVDKDGNKHYYINDQKLEYG